MNSRLYILTFCLIILRLAAYAQEAPVYYGKNGRVISNRDSAEYYRVIDSRNGDNFNFTEYHKDGTWIKATAKGNLTQPAYSGLATIYYKTGKVAVVNEYENDRLLKTTGYYPNGVLLQVINYRNGWPNALVVYDADSSGHVHIFNGNGIRKETDTLRSYHISERFTTEGPYKNGIKEGLWKGTDDRGFAFEEMYEDGKLVSGTTKTPDGKKYHYDKTFEYPSFKGDIDKFEKQIIPDLKDPADTAGLRFFKPGILRLSYIIKEDGTLADLKGYKKDHSQVKLELKDDHLKCRPANLRGVPIAYSIYNNADFMIRHNFSPFQVDPRFKGATWTLR